MNLATLNDHSERILRVLVHIQCNLDHELSLESLAGVACFSPFHFHRVFAALVGESVMAHIRRLRLERAAQRLLSTKATVLQIALDAGYETHEAFTRAFKVTLGKSPSAFRRQRGGIDLASPSGVHYASDGALSYNPMHYGGADMEVKIEEWEPRTVAFVRHIGPYNECGKAWDKLCTWAGPQGMLAGEPFFAGISYDDPQITPGDKIRYDACLAVTEDVKPEGEIGVQQVAGGKYACALHEGPYENFHKTYSYLYAEWLPQNRYKCRDFPCVEIYYNEPESTPPEDLLTLVCIPIEEA